MSYVLYFLFLFCVFECCLAIGSMASVGVSVRGPGLCQDSVVSTANELHI